jgi:hypothetical protein
MVDFLARAPHFAAEKICTAQKNRAEKENLMHKHKGRSIWCGDGGIVLATGMSSRGNARVGGFRA